MTIQWTDGLTLKLAERELLRTALVAHSFDIRATSKALGVCRATVYKKHLEHFGISVPELRKRLAVQARIADDHKHGLIPDPDLDNSV